MQKVAQKNEALGFMSERDQKELMSHGHMIEFKEDRCLFTRGEEGGSFYIVLSGCVFFSINSPSGKEIILNKLHAGEVFGEIAMLDQGARTADAYVVKGSKLLSISRSNFFDFLDSKPSLYRGVIDLLCQRLRWCSGQVESFVLSSGLERLIGKLLYLAELTDMGSVIQLEITQTDLAKQLDLSREVVNRELRNIEAQGVIKLGRGKITIPDIQKLRNFRAGR